MKALKNTILAITIMSIIAITAQAGENRKQENNDLDQAYSAMAHTYQFVQVGY